MELILIFMWPVVAALFASLAFSWLGVNVVAEDRSLKVLCIAQGASQGALIYLLVAHLMHFHVDGGLMTKYVGLLFSLFFGWATGLIVDNVSQRVHEKSSVILSIFLVLLSFNHLFSSAFPALENHMSQMFFGDLATMMNHEAYVLCAAFILLSFWLWGKRRINLNRSFELTVLGEQRASGGLLVSLMVAIGVQFLGFLFTAALIVVPTVLVRMASPSGLNQHYALVALVSCTGALAGFLISILNSHIPTVPMIVLLVCLLGGMVTLVKRGHRYIRQHASNLE